MNILDSVELTEEQGQEAIKRINAWKRKVEREAEEKMEFFQEEIEQKSEEKYSAMFEEAQEKLQEVYANRLDEATKELYNVIKERTVKDIKSTDEYRIIEKVKDLVAPFIVESGMRETVVEIEKQKEMLEAEIEKLKAQRKLENLLKDLPENVQFEIKEMMSEVVNEEEVVEEFNKAIKLMKLTKNQLESEADEEIEEGIDPDPNPKNQIDPSGETPKGKSPVKSESISDEDILNILNEDIDEEGEIMTEGDQQVENQPTVNAEMARMRQLALGKK